MSMSALVSEEMWERLYAPYDASTYHAVLQHLQPQDVVLEIGAGELCFAGLAAPIVRQVIAIEINPVLIEHALSHGPLPANLHVVCADAQEWTFPIGITTGVLLMRHCTHFKIYANKLRQCGAARLITNARWRLNVEVIELHAPQRAYTDFRIGPYACQCGATGFKPGPVEAITQELLDFPQEVFYCPQCKPELCSEPPSTLPVIPTTGV
ncbi:MAG: rRNA adenine methyltransferase [Anaerolineae bacterium]|nr:MAG: rRNA adenine methyltransferase [Anaerolineae bacterium]